MDDVTRILSAIERETRRHQRCLLPLVYDELRKLAAQRLARCDPARRCQATANCSRGLSAVDRYRVTLLEQSGAFLLGRRRGHAGACLIDNARRKRAR